MECVAVVKFSVTKDGEHLIITDLIYFKNYNSCVLGAMNLE